MCRGEIMIYTLNACDYLIYLITKAAFNLSENDVYSMIKQDFSLLNKRLEMKKIKYESLKKALIPNQEKNKNEVCLVFDSSFIDEYNYGYAIFKELIPLFNKDSTYSILVGDYVDSLYNLKESQRILFDNLEENIIKCNDSTFKYSGQYYLVYINRINNSEFSNIINGVKQFKWFYGYCVLNNNSKFKSYLSYILTHLCIKNKNVVIGSHPNDVNDEQNMNIIGYPFEKNSFKFVSINEDSYGVFLSYKIESILPDKDDVGFSFNALFPKFDSIEKLTINITDGRLDYLNSGSTGKDGILKSIGLYNIEKEKFKRIIFRTICGKYIYCLEHNQYGDYKFNVCVELPTSNRNIRKTTIALKYYPNSGEIEILTIT